MKDVVLQIRITDEERTLFVRESAEQGITVSAWARAALMKAAEATLPVDPQEEDKKRNYRMRSPRLDAIPPAIDPKATVSAGKYMAAGFVMCKHERVKADCLACEKGR